MQRSTLEFLCAVLAVFVSSLLVVFLVRPWYEPGKAESAPASQPVASVPYHIAFASDRDAPDSGEWEIYDVFSDGTDLRRLTDSPGTNLMPAYSPDGSQIVFASTRSGVCNLYVMRADGTQQRRVTEHSLTDTTPCWISAEDVAFARFSEDADNPTDLLAVNVSSGTIRRITNSPGSDLSPHWMPDADTMVFVSDRERRGRFREFQLYRCALDGSGQALFSIPRGARAAQDSCLQPSLSHDRDALVFRRFRSYGRFGTESVWWWNTDTGSMVEVLWMRVPLDGSVFTPDGDKLLVSYGDPLRLHFLDISARALGEMAVAEEEEDLGTAHLKPFPLEITAKHVAVSPFR